MSDERRSSLLMPEAAFALTVIGKAAMAAGDWISGWAETWREKTASAPFAYVRVALESIALIAFFALIDLKFPQGVFGFSPYWIPVVLITAQYGSRGGLLVTLTATAASYGLHGPSRLASQDFYDYAAALVGQPCSWLVYSLALGGLQDLHKSKEIATEDELAATREGAEAIGDGLERALVEIQKLEMRIAGDRATLDAFMGALANVDVRGENELLESFVDMVRAATGADHVMLLLCEGEGFRLAARVHDEHCPLLVLPAPPATLIEDVVATRQAVLWDCPTAALAAAKRVYVAPICRDAAQALRGLLVISRGSPDGKRDAVRRLEQMGRLLDIFLDLMSRRVKDSASLLERGG
jgi:hypothetical protein